MSKPFQFKEFAVAQDRCAMKIGTDGVLLGAWTPLTSRPQSILDIGAGTGVLSLMLAQRSEAFQIDAVEIDAPAYEQCIENFEQSPWNDRLFCYHASFQEFWQEMEGEEAYDLIVSNPPFYTESFKTKDTQRDLARFQDALPFEHLVYGVSLLLSKKGIFSLVVPSEEEEKIVAIAAEVHLFPKKITRVRGNASSPIKRSLLTFSFEEALVEEDELAIETERHQYTPEYISLTKDFYLKM